jgi:hypothetical protein
MPLAGTNIPKAVRAGDFFCVQGSSSSGRWIKGAEIIDDASPDAAEFQHAGIVTKVTWPTAGVPNVTILEAEGDGAIETAYHYDGAHIIWSTGAIVPSAVQRPNIVAGALTLKGAKYGYLDYAALGLHHYHVDIPGLRAYIGWSKRLICSQLVDRAYELGDYHLFVKPPRWNGYVKPSDLSQLLINLGVTALGPAHDSW